MRLDEPVSAPAIPTSAAARVPSDRAPRAAAAAAGALAAAVAIGLSELLAGLVEGAPSLVITIGDLIIDLQPPGAKDLVVDLFGTNDKLAVNIGIVAAALAIAALVGMAARVQWRKGVLGFVIAGAVALFASLREPLVAPVLAVVTPILAVAASLWVLRYLLLAAGPAWVPGGPLGARAAPARTAPGGTMPDWQRRSFLIRGGGVAAGSVLAGVLGRVLLERQGGGSLPGTASPSLAPNASPMPTLAVGGSFDSVAGITPLVVPNGDFYRIDAALIVPRVNVATWTLQVTGMVDRPLTLTYDELVAMPMFEQYVTIACVSNKVGDHLVGNALWRGVHLRDVLAAAGARPGATQIVGRSVDGFTAGFPTEWAMDPARDPMIAVLMNGEPLPRDHGYPARLIIPGLYGYVSATKWLSAIELTTLEAFDGYWIPLGWSKEGPILTQSRIDVPRSGASVAAGPVTIAGVAWAPDRGIAKVEITVDDGDWQPATLSTPISRATWVQWRLDTTLAAGEHQIEVRATDGTGVVQTVEQTPPAPNGARGHHTIRVRAA